MLNQIKQPITYFVIITHSEYSSQERECFDTFEDAIHCTKYIDWYSDTFTVEKRYIESPIFHIDCGDTLAEWEVNICRKENCLKVYEKNVNTHRYTSNKPTIYTL